MQKGPRLPLAPQPGRVSSRSARRRSPPLSYLHLSSCLLASASSDWLRRSPQRSAPRIRLPSGLGPTAASISVPPTLKCSSDGSLPWSAATIIWSNSDRPIQCFNILQRFVVNTVWSKLRPMTVLMVRIEWVLRDSLIPVEERQNRRLWVISPAHTSATSTASW